jgi:cell division protein FtsI/penicillin-binding protein 2
MMDAAVPTTSQPWRIAIAAIAFAGCFAWIVFRLHHLQLERGESLSLMGERQRLRSMTLSAPRGSIYDSSGVPLAVSDGRWAIYADPGYMDDKLRATVELHRILGMSRDELRAHFESRFNGRRIAQGLDDRQADAIRDLRLAGISMRREYLRFHPEKDFAPHVLGFVLADGRGGAGIEQEFNQVLSGTPGKETYAVDAVGNPILIERESTPAHPGGNVQLTIDIAIQRELEAALLAAVDRHHPTNAAAVVVRPGTGEIVALASWPTFDCENLSELKTENLRNNVLSFVYEPGSTMKPLVAGAAIHEGLATWNERIFCENGRWTYRVGRAARTITDHSVKHGGHQYLTVVEGIAKSDNILMAKLGIKMGPERLYSWISNFRFGNRLGIQLPGEDAGMVRPAAKWDVLGSCMSIPMGHEIAVTPLQMAMAHSAVANGGVWLPPRLVRRVWHVDADGREVDASTGNLPEARRMFTPTDAARIQSAMTHTMTEGTGTKASLNGYTSAGKTGTTEKLVNGHYSSDSHIGSFVCWAPATEGVRPELLALVVIDDPRQNGHYGSETAAPVVQRVLQFGLEHLGIPKDPNAKGDDEDER